MTTAYSDEAINAFKLSYDATSKTNVAKIRALLDYDLTLTDAKATLTMRVQFQGKPLYIHPGSTAGPWPVYFASAYASADGCFNGLSCVEGGATTYNSGTSSYNGVVLRGHQYDGFGWNTAAYNAGSWVSKFRPMYGTSTASSVEWSATVTKSIDRTHSSQTSIISFYAQANDSDDDKTSGNIQTFGMDKTAVKTVSLTVPAKPSYSVTYNANGGSGAPAAQTKWYGEALTLSSTKPTRYQHRFDGWATSATGAVAYAPGASYTGNAALSLYAHWTKSFDLPTVSNVTAERWSKPNGVAAANGSSAKVEFDWTIDAIQLEKSQTAPTELKVTVFYGDKSWTEYVPDTGLSGHSSVIVGNGELRPDTAYSVKVEIEDVNSTASATALIGADPEYFRPVIPPRSTSGSTDIQRTHTHGGLGLQGSKLMSKMTQSQVTTFDAALLDQDDLGEWFLARVPFQVYQSDMESDSPYAHTHAKVTVRLSYAGGIADAFERVLFNDTIPSGSDAVAFAFGTFDLDTAPPFPDSGSPYLAVITVSDGYNETSVTLDSYGYYAAPLVSYLLTYRCDDTGKDDDEGVNAKVVMRPNMITSGTQTHLKAVKIRVSERDSGTVVADRVYNYDPKAAREGEMEFLLKAQDGDTYKTNPETGAKILFDTDLSYLVTVTVEDVYSSGTKSDVVSLAFFTMDVLAGGHGVAFGKPAKREMLDVAMPAQFDSALRIAEQLDWPVFHFDSEIPMVDSSESDLPVVPCVAVVTKYYEGLANTRPAEVWACYSQIPETWLKLYPSSAVTGITRSGTTFTATREDGTTFTFDQDHSSNSLSDMRFTWSSSVTTTDWFLAHDTAATGTPLFRAITPANARAAMEAAAANHTHSSLETLASISGSSQSAALKARFDSYKSSTPRNKLIDYYSSAMGNGALAMGYFLNGYDSSPYGGFFVCHYNTPRYVGIDRGTYYDHILISDRNYTTYCVPKRSVLYNNTTGTNGTVTLSASAANYNHMRVFFRTNDNLHGCNDVFSPNTKYVDLSSNLVRGSVNIYWKTRMVRINGTSIASASPISTNQSVFFTEVYHSGGGVDSPVNIYVTRVEAWNE